MPDLYKDVKQFMDKIADQRDVPIDDKLLRLREGLIFEEFNEVSYEFVRYIEASKEPLLISDSDLANIRAHLTKELCDLLYVTVGAFIALGLPYEEAWKLVQDSNMAKTNGHRAPSGKWIKPEGWVGPYAAIEKLLKES